MKIKTLVMGVMKTNCYIIWCEKCMEGSVIDPGSNISKIMEIIKKNNLNIKYILNTHYHSDHTGGNKLLKKKTGAKILLHKNDLKLLRKIICPVRIFTFNFIRSPLPDILIEKEEIITFGNIKLQVIHTPGHTPGGICFYSDKKLFSGDTLFVGDSGATNFEGGDRNALGKSIRKLMQILPEDTVIYPGHDYGPTPTSTLKWEKMNNVNAIEYGFYNKK